MKIGFRITVLMIAMSLASVGVLGSVLIFRSWKNAEQLSMNFTRSTVRHMASQFETFLEGNWEKVVTVTKVMDRMDSLSPELRRPFVNEILKEMLENDPHLVAAWSVWDPGALGDNDRDWLGTPGVDAAGRFIPFLFRTDAGTVIVDTLEDLETGAYNLEPRRRGRQVVTNPYHYNVGGRDVTMASIASPIRNRAGRTVGVVGVDIDLRRLDNITQDIGSLESDGRASAAISAAFSNDGTVVSHFDSGRIGQDFRLTERDILGAYIDTMATGIAAGNEMFFSTEVGGDTFWFLTVPVRIADFPDPWAISLARPLYEAHAETYRMIWFAVFLCVLVIAATSVAALFMSRSIARPIGKMAAALEDIATGEGDLTVNLPEGRTDEIGDASRFFNRTIGKIRELVLSIKNQASMLTDIGNDLASNMTETAAAMNEIAANLQSIRSRVINQSASVSETNATMEQVTVNIDRLSDHVQRQTYAVSQSSSAIEEMLANIQSVTSTLVKNAANVRDLRESSDSGRTSLQEVASDIREIARESEGLMEINGVMENIASQTNLLSMNAAIEAAHAGESGKGFAVVADEIRKLAESSGEQSKTIGLVLKKIKGAIDKITKSTDNVLQKFEAIDHGVKTVAEQEDVIRAAMEEQSEGSRQVLQASGQVSEITQQVKGGSQEMLEGSREVIRESKNLERATQEITNGINEMAAGAEQVNLAVNSVSDLSGRNRENISILVRAVSQFKV